MLQLTTFEWVPPFAQGYVRDLAVRWACEEASIPYAVRLINSSMAASEDYVRQQPFAQVPVIEENGLTIFESGSILLYLGEKSETLLPQNINDRLRARSWVFAALNSIDPLVQYFNDMNELSKKEAWALPQRSVVLDRLKKRLAYLEHWLKNREYLEHQFSVGDIMMTLILRNLANAGVLELFLTLDQYLKRNEERPAFKKALADQLKTFTEHTPHSTSSL